MKKPSDEVDIQKSKSLGKEKKVRMAAEAQAHILNSNIRENSNKSIVSEEDPAFKESPYKILTDEKKIKMQQKLLWPSKAKKHKTQANKMQNSNDIMSPYEKLNSERLVRKK